MNTQPSEVKKLIDSEKVVNTVHITVSEPARAETNLPRPPARTARGRKFSMTELESCNSLNSAIRGLIKALEKHRLMFLYFANAERIDPNCAHRPTGIRESLSKDEILGYSDMMKDIDSEGEFLFRHECFLNCFAQTAFDMFGTGVGLKAFGEGASLPYWNIDFVAARHLESSASDIGEWAIKVRMFDETGVYASITEQALNSTNLEGELRWYMGSGIEWKYLTDLDETIVVVRNARFRNESLVDRDGSPMEVMASMSKVHFVEVTGEQRPTREDGGAGAGDKKSGGRTVAPKDQENRKLVHARWEEFRRDYRKHEFTRGSCSNAARWMTDNFDDMDFLTAELDDVTDYQEIGKRIKAMIRAFKATPEPKRDSQH